MTLETSLTPDQQAIIFGEPPAPEEIDKTFCAQPWVLRTRLTFDAFAARCRQAGVAPSFSLYFEHQNYTTEEIDLLNDMMEAQRECHVDEVPWRFFIRDYGSKPRLGRFDSSGNLQTMSVPDFKAAFIDKTIEVGFDDNGKPKEMPLAEHWLRSPFVKRYERVEFRPGTPQRDMPKGVLNLWRGWPEGLVLGTDDYRIGPDGAVPVTNGEFDGPDMPKGHCDFFMFHMLHHMCGGDHEVFFYLCAWMADALLNPGPCETAIVLRGPQGSGKTLWARCLMEFFGPHALTLDDSKHVVGTFNKHLMNTSVMFADEAFFAGNRQHAAKLKGLITSPELFVEPKGVDGFVVPKMFRVIMASNDEHVVRADGDDRRYLVLDVDAGEHNQDKDFFAALMAEWHGGGRKALFRWLTGTYWRETVGEGRFRHLERPVTAGLQDQKTLSLPPAQMLIQNMLHDGEVPAAFAADIRSDRVFVATQLLVEGSRLGNEHTKAIGNLLRTLAGPKAKNERVYIGEGRSRRQHRGFWLPPLSVCRRRWEEHLGRAVAWPADVEDWALGSVAPDPDEPF